MNHKTSGRAVYRHVVVVGAGYAGVMAANRLATNALGPRFHVTVVNPIDVFVERIRLHEVAAGTRESATHPLSELLNGHVTIVVDSVTEIRPNTHQVVTANGTVLDYDALIYSPGSAAAEPPAGTCAVHRRQDALKLQSRLRQLTSGRKVAVVGGGLTGVETVAECAQQHPELGFTLVTSHELAPSVGAAARSQLRRRLRALNVDLDEQREPVKPDTLKGALGVDEVVWTVGFEFPDLAQRSGLAVDGRNRLLVDKTLRSLSNNAIFGAGDAATLDDPAYDYLRPGCAAALPQGAHAADSIVAMFSETAPQPLSMGYVMQAISLGRGSGVIQAVRADDTARQLHLHGQLAAFTKEAICRMTVKWMRAEAHKNGSFSWPRGATLHPKDDVEATAQQ